MSIGYNGQVETVKLLNRLHEFINDSVDKSVKRDEMLDEIKNHVSTIISNNI